MEKRAKKLIQGIDWIHKDIQLKEDEIDQIKNQHLFELKERIRIIWGLVEMLEEKNSEISELKKQIK